MPRGRYQVTGLAEPGLIGARKSSATQPHQLSCSSRQNYAIGQEPHFNTNQVGSFLLARRGERQLFDECYFCGAGEYMHALAGTQNPVVLMSIPLGYSLHFSGIDLSDVTASWAACYLKKVASSTDTHIEMLLRVRLFRKSSASSPCLPAFPAFQWIQQRCLPGSDKTKLFFCSQLLGPNAQSRLSSSRPAFTVARRLSRTFGGMTGLY